MNALEKNKYLLQLGLGLTFLASSLTAFLNPGEYREIIEHSVLFSPLLEKLPFFVSLIGINDLTIGFLLLTRSLPKMAAWWATAWLTGLVFVLLSQASQEGFLTAMEHAAPLAVAIYLAVGVSVPSSIGKITEAN